MEKSIYRIIDANFNRAREAARVMEEFCRFGLNCEHFTVSVKQIRHELCGEIAKLDTGKLISCRDTTGDVGAGKTIENQMKRKELQDVFTAACKRLGEALRVLSEMTQALNPKISAKFEELRFAGYKLEKDIVLFADCFEKFCKVKFYVIITNDIPSEILLLAASCAAGGADCIQLRAKDMDDGELFSTACEFVRICKDSNIVSIINDRVDIALAAGADGVHLGQDDLPIEEARKLQSYPLITGKSTHSMEQLKAACLERPTYAAIGPVFATGTKPTAPAVTTGYVKEGTEFLADSGICHVAIGGITLENIHEVMRAGAKTISVCAAVTHSADPAGMCRAFRKKMDEFNKNDAGTNLTR